MGSLENQTNSGPANDLLILPCLGADGMNLFLAQRSDKYRDKFIPLISDCAPSDSERALKIPPHMMPASVSAKSPELNPVENMWQEIGEKSSLNLSFESMEQLRNGFSLGMDEVEK